MLMKMLPMKMSMIPSTVNGLSCGGSPDAAPDAGRWYCRPHSTPLGRPTCARDAASAKVREAAGKGLAEVVCCLARDGVPAAVLVDFVGDSLELARRAVVHDQWVYAMRRARRRASSSHDA